MLNWADIDTVLLDMDGTLLDLHFDNYFWLQHLPQRWAQISGISVSDAEAQLKAEYADHNQKIMTLEQQRDELNSQLNQAVAERQTAQEQLEQANRAYEQLKVQLENTQSSIWEKPMVLGSLILLAGLLFGLLLPLILPKKRNNERWM